MRFFLLAIVVVPVVELAVLVAVGRWLGAWPTVLLVLLTGVLGVALAESQGLAVWRNLRASLAAGVAPGPELLEAALVLAGSLLLLAPGFVTDAAGLLLLLPPSRRWMRHRLEGWLWRRLAGGGRWRSWRWR